MLDVRPVAYVTPIAEQEIGPLTPVLRVQNLADEDAVISGLVRIYRESTGLQIYHSVLASTPLPHGTTVDVSALTPWNPGAPADDDYFCLAQVDARSLLTGQLQSAQLGQFFFDITPAPMGQPPATHHTTHEFGGMDELDCTGLVGAGGIPAPHDIAGASHTSTATPGQILQADAQGLPVDATNSDADVAAAVGASHTQNTDTDLEAVFEATLEHVANKGVAGGYCGLPNPLDPTLPLRADGTPARPAGMFFETNALYYTTGALPPWIATAISTGTLAAVAGTVNHPGIVSFSSSTSANSGHFARIAGTNGILISGGEKSDIIIRPQTLSGTTIRFGFHDSVNVSAPVDGCYIYLDPATGKISGRTMNNSASSTTGTDYQLVSNTWYRLRVEVNAAANLVTFTCFNEAGAVLWTDTVNSNIPTAAGRETGHGIVATNSGTSAVALCDIDYLNIEIARVLVR
jgi:hypothetical protein